MSVSHCIKPYKKEIWIERCLYRSYGEFCRERENVFEEMTEVKNKIKQLCLCTPADLFPSDENGDTYANINERMDDLFDELNDLEWRAGRINMIQTILDDWKYMGNKDPEKYWDVICPDPYEDLRKDFQETIDSMDGNPETIKKMKEETDKVNEELAKRLSDIEN